MSIRQITKQRLLDLIHEKGGWKIFLVDETTTKILSAACRMYDLIERGITLVEKLEIERQPLPQFEAFYFLSPTSSSIDLLLKDWKNEKSPQYAAVHLLFSSALGNEEFNKIKQNKFLVSRIKTMKEVNIDYLAFEQRVFHFNMPKSFFSLYSPESSDSQVTQKLIAEKLANICATLEEYPLIRYMDSPNIKLSAAIAKYVQDRIDSLMRSNPDYSKKANKSSSRATLLILDRSHDVIAPILHEFTYQAMAYDLLNVDLDKHYYKYNTLTTGGANKDVEVILDEHDLLWPTLRHMHIADTIEWILGAFDEFLKENKASQFYQGKTEVNSLEEMSAAMKAMPQYQEMLGKYSLHINLSDQCMKVFNKKNLVKVAGLEQDMSTGEDSEGKQVKNILVTLPPLLELSSIDQDDKLRLLMIYIISQEGIKDPDRKRLMDIAKVSLQDQGCISNLRHLGVTLLKGAQAKKKQKLKEKKKKKGTESAPAYELSRYVPNLKKIGEDFLQNSLPNSEFPYVKEPLNSEPEVPVSSKEGTSLRTQPKWAQDRKTSKAEKPAPTGSRLIIFVAGGMTFSETRVVYELSQKFNREVFIGSTHLITPTTFIQELRSLKKVDTVDGDF